MATLLDFLLPQRCVACRSVGEQVCKPCLAGLPRLAGALCERCGAPTEWPVGRCRECAGRRLSFVHARAAVAYDPAVRSFVNAWKERGLRRLAALASEIVLAAFPRPPAEAVSFVPPDGERSVKRGHHPAERLARLLAEGWDLPVEPLVGRARRVERPQRGLALAERRRNVCGAFRPVRPAPRAVVLIDDVYTTGATVNAAAAALRKGGARRVEVVTFARAVR